jgi:hypothetical protein
VAFGDEDNRSTTAYCNTSWDKANGRSLRNRCVGHVQKLEVGSRLEGEGVTLRRRSIGTAPPILSLGNRWTLLVNFKPRTLYHREKDTGTNLKGGGVGPRDNLYIFWRIRKILPLSVCELQTVQLLA